MKSPAEIINNSLSIALVFIHTIKGNLKLYLEQRQTQPSIPFFTFCNQWFFSQKLRNKYKHNFPSTRGLILSLWEETTLSIEHHSFSNKLSSVSNSGSLLNSFLHGAKDLPSVCIGLESSLGGRDLPRPVSLQQFSALQKVQWQWSSNFHVNQNHLWYVQIPGHLFQRLWFNRSTVEPRDLLF